MMGDVCDDKIICKDSKPKAQTEVIRVSQTLNSDSQYAFQMQMQTRLSILRVGTQPLSEMDPSS